MGGLRPPTLKKKSLFRQNKAQHHRDDEDAGDGAVGKDSSDDWGEGVKNRGIDEGGSDAKAKRQCHDDHVAIAEPAVGDHVDSVVDDGTEHHHGASAEDGIGQGVKKGADGGEERGHDEDEGTHEYRKSVDDFGHGDESDVLAE